MKISKKTLLSLIKENLNEMPMDFDPNMPERPHSDIQAKLQTGDTPLKKIPFPKTGREENNPTHNYQELVASQRYKQVIEKLRGFGIQDPVTQISDMNDYVASPIAQLMGAAHKIIVQIENRFRPRLAQLAVDLVTEVWQIPEGYCQWDVQIIGMGEIDPNDFKQDEPNEQNPEEVPVQDYSDAVEIIGDLEKLNLERAKRRFINLIVQGASKRGHYMYEMVPDKLQQIVGNQSNNLMYNYGVLMSTNDTLYWQLGEEMMGMSKGQVGGEEDVDPNTEPPTIKVRAVNFPIAIHECIKGWLELVAVKGEPEDLNDRDVYQQAMEKEDTLDKERWDLLLGPAIWDKISQKIPQEIYSNQNLRSYQNFLLMEIFKLPAKKMLVLLKEVVAHTQIGDRLIAELIEAIKENMNQFQNDMISYESNQALQRFNDDLNNITDQTDNDNLKDILGNMGIRLSNEDENDLEDENGNAEDEIW
jgi:hypothetical protein